MTSLFHDNGVGVGLRPAHIPLFLEQPPRSVAWVEVVSENYMPWKGQSFGKAIQTLEKVRAHLPVALHGVSMNLGSTDPVDLDYLSRLQTLIQVIDPLVVSDHLSWTGVNGHNLHDLMPVPYTREALTVMREKIDQVQNHLGRRILIENPSSYLEFTSSTMSEPEFIRELLTQADCGLLLDINNVYVSSVNHGFDPIAYLKALPRERIGQMHLAGHSQKQGYLIDTHDAPVCAQVWTLYRWAVAHFGTHSVMVERDGNIPEWNELEREILKIGEIHEQAAIAG